MLFSDAPSLPEKPDWQLTIDASTTIVTNGVCESDNHFTVYVTSPKFGLHTYDIKHGHKWGKVWVLLKSLLFTQITDITDRQTPFQFTNEEHRSTRSAPMSVSALIWGHMHRAVGHPSRSQGRLLILECRPLEEEEALNTFLPQVRNE